jgi:glycosyltransferase involved in cell wall biosynthesis
MCTFPVPVFNCLLDYQKSQLLLWLLRNMHMKRIAIVVPIYNEEKNIAGLYQELTMIMKEYHDCYAFELILVNDGSKDGSWVLLQELAYAHGFIKAINFSRNFGHQMALTAGYDYADADAAITMDADLQDPPQLIHSMIAAWEQGNHIVYARRLNRDDGFLKKYTAGWYYHLLDSVAEVKIPRNVGDFRLIDKSVLHELKKCREKSRYLRGMVAWMGFKHTYIDFIRPNRTAGVTGYTWQKMFKLAFDGLTGFSLFPLKLAAYSGVFVIITGCLMFSYITIDTLLHRVYYPLFKWLVTVIYIFMGVLFLLLWIIGEYIGRIFEQQKERPLYIVEEVVHDAGKKVSSC